MIETWSTQRRTCHNATCPLKMLQGLFWNWTQASMVIGHIVRCFIEQLCQLLGLDSVIALMK